MVASDDYSSIYDDPTQVRGPDGRLLHEYAYPSLPAGAQAGHDIDDYEDPPPPVPVSRSRPISSSSSAAVGTRAAPPLASSVSPPQGESTPILLGEGSEIYGDPLPLGGDALLLDSPVGTADHSGNGLNPVTPLGMYGEAVPVYGGPAEEPKVNYGQPLSNAGRGGMSDAPPTTVSGDIYGDPLDEHKPEPQRRAAPLPPPPGQQPATAAEQRVNSVYGEALPTDAYGEEAAPRILGDENYEAVDEVFAARRPASGIPGGLGSEIYTFQVPSSVPVMPVAAQENYDLLPPLSQAAQGGTLPPPRCGPAATPDTNELYVFHQPKSRPVSQTVAESDGAAKTAEATADTGAQQRRLQVDGGNIGESSTDDHDNGVALSGIARTEGEETHEPSMVVPLASDDMYESMPEDVLKSVSEKAQGQLGGPSASTAAGGEQSVEGAVQATLESATAASAANVIEEALDSVLGNIVESNINAALAQAAKNLATTTKSAEMGGKQAAQAEENAGMPGNGDGAGDGQQAEEEVVVVYLEDLQGYANLDAIRNFYDVEEDVDSADEEELAEKKLQRAGNDAENNNQALAEPLPDYGQPLA